MPAPIWLATAMVSVRALTKITELIGVLNFGCRRENQRGSRQSQPATIGNRELPVTWTLVDAIVRTVIKIIAMDARALATGKKRNPRRSVCGTGPMRSIGLSPMNASTELVPRMNARAITGDAMTTERPISRAGDRVSPARIATYSNPLSAPTASLVKMLTQKKIDIVGAARTSG